MRRIIKAVLGTVALATGIVALGAPQTNVVTFDWFGRFCAAALVCLIALWLLGAFREDEETGNQAKHEILKEG